MLPTFVLLLASCKSPVKPPLQFNCKSQYFPSRLTENSAVSQVVIIKAVFFIFFIFTIGQRNKSNVFRWTFLWYYKVSSYWINKALGILVWYHTSSWNIVMKWLAGLSAWWGVISAKLFLVSLSSSLNMNIWKSIQQRYFWTESLEMSQRKLFASFIINVGDFSELLGTRSCFSQQTTFIWKPSYYSVYIPKGSLDWVVHD